MLRWYGGRMRLPFSLEQFLETFRSYNTAVGAAPLLLVALALAILAVAHTAATWRHRAIAAGLATLWFWSGIVYHWGFFARINPAAKAFGALFVLQGVVILFAAFAHAELTFDPRPRRASIAGWGMIGYALVAYPLIGMMLGHGYPVGPTFGAPCPTTIFFFGVMSWVIDKPPIKMLILPIAWAVVGTSAAVQLGMREDLGLAVAAVIVLAYRSRRTVFPPTGSRPRLFL